MVKLLRGQGGPDAFKVRVALVVAFVGTAAAIGAVMASEAGKVVAMPGPLTPAHAMLSDRCESCHEAGLGSIQSVLHGVSQSRLGMAQSRLCLECHQIPGDAFAAHNTPGMVPADGLHGVPTTGRGEVACATCHHEHRGRSAPLAGLTGAECQTCHSETFASIDSGHPGLGGYPYRAPTGIVFDHEAHLNTYFAASDRTDTSCNGCHTRGPLGEKMVLRAFENTCASCHSAEIATGLAVFSVPALDLDTLRERGVGIGAWPADAFECDTPLTPFMAALLGADTALEPDLDTVGGLDLADLTTADEASLAAVGRVAWAVKALYKDIAERGQAALLARAGQGADAPAMAGQLPRDLFDSATDEWFPGLVAELAAHQAGRPTPTGAGAEYTQDESDRAQREWVSAGGWYRQSVDYSIYYRPASHEDAFLRAWVTRAAGATGGDNPQAAHALVSAGGCTSCHSVSDGAVRWATDLGSSAGEPLTHFSHAPHLTALGDDGCTACHTPDSHDGAYLAGYSGSTAGGAVAAFAPMTLTSCTECHAANKAPTACLTCHSYHPAE